MEVDFACVKDTILLAFPSSEVKEETESCGVAPGTMN